MTPDVLKDPEEMFTSFMVASQTGRGFSCQIYSLSSGTVARNLFFFFFLFPNFLRIRRRWSFKEQPYDLLADCERLSPQDVFFSPLLLVHNTGVSQADWIAAVNTLPPLYIPKGPSGLYFIPRFLCEQGSRVVIRHRGMSLEREDGGSL